MKNRTLGLFVILSISILTIGNAVNRKDSVIVLKPQPKYQVEVNYVRQILANVHYRKVPLSDSLSNVIFDNYFNSLDYNKSYFFKSDLDYFSKYRNQLDNDLERGNVDVGFQVYRIFRDRANARLNHVQELLKGDFDFSKEESIRIDEEKTGWAKNDTELNDRWRKIVKSQALSLKLSGKADTAISKLLVDRYKRYQKSINQNNSDDVFEIFMNAYTETLDPHTNYLSPPASDKFNIDMSKSLEGIGARLVQELDYTVIFEKVPGGPAFKNENIINEDKIVGVAQGEDGEFVDIVGWRITDVVQIIRGPKGSIVRLQLIRGEVTNIPFVVTIERDKINLEDGKATSEVIPISEGNQSYKLGVIKIPSFYQDFSESRNGEEFTSVTGDVKKIIEDLKTKDVDGILVDLRFNGGGSLPEAIRMTGLFIDNGPVVQVKSSNGQVNVHKDLEEGIVYDGPLAVLTNRFSASASEIFSGAIQDYKRGIILGESTFGKGTVQRMVSLNQQMPNYPEKMGNLKLTLQMFYRVTGSSTQNIGVSADINYPSAFSAEKYGESSKPAALPWEKIEESDYTTTNYISQEMKDKLTELYLGHLEIDEDLIKLSKDVEKAKESREKESLSLNYDERKDEKDADSDDSDESKNSLEGTTINVDSEFTATEKDSKKLKKDPYLKESLRLLAAMSKLKIG
ncbi:MAG: carboxyl-terminal processing protease [Cyclobacteriaceae bacterium]|jgi:carboxyl-terminal processing protease